MRVDKGEFLKEARHLTSLKAIVLGLMTFFSLYAFTQALLPLLNSSDAWFVFQIELLIVSSLTWLTSGYIAGWIARTHGWLHGILMAPITAVFQEVDCYSHFQGMHGACNVRTFGGYLLFGFVLMGTGGLLWDIKQRITREG